MEINKDYRIMDNFLDKNIFLNIKNIMENDEFPWFFVKKINENHDINDLTSYFVHMFFLESNENSRISNYFNLIVPIITKINMLKLIRIKGNVYLNTETKIIHEKHVDYNYPHKGAIYYINTNNGKTILNNNLEIDSIENRLLIFNPNIPHSSTSTTDSKFRMNINFNYI
jgi:hypothetical protein